MKKFFLFCMMMITIFSCKKESKTDHQITSKEKTTENSIKKNADSSTKESMLQISFMNGFPKEIDGCSCYFSDTKENLSQGKYLYADNYAQTCFIKINDSIEKFKITNDENLTDPQLQKDFENENYIGKIIVEKIPSKTYENQGNELWFYQGNLEITHKKTGEKMQRALFGECGC